MKKVLLVSGSETGRESLLTILREMGYTDIVAVADAPAAHHAVQTADFALAVINAPLPDAAQENLCRYLTDNTFASVVLLVKETAVEETVSRLEPIGVTVLGKPLQVPLFRRLLRVAVATRQRLLGLRSENRQLQSQIDELRLVDRAKCVLIQYLCIGEPQAHRYIEKQAMDRRVPRAEIAREILKTYEL